MTKLASKAPKEVKSIVSVSDIEAEVWYAHPVKVGKIFYRGGSWYTTNGVRFAAARDAQNYLIKLHEEGTKIPMELPQGLATKVEVEAPKPRAQVRGATAVNEVTVAALIKFLQANPDVLIKP